MVTILRARQNSSAGIVYSIDCAWHPPALPWSCKLKHMKANGTLIVQGVVQPYPLGEFHRQSIDVQCFQTQRRFGIYVGLRHSHMNWQSQTRAIACPQNCSVTGLPVCNDVGTRLRLLTFGVILGLCGHERLLRRHVSILVPTWRVGACGDGRHIAFGHWMQMHIPQICHVQT